MIWPTFNCCGIWWRFWFYGCCYFMKKVTKNQHFRLFFVREQNIMINYLLCHHEKSSPATIVFLLRKRVMMVTDYDINSLTKNHHLRMLFLIEQKYHVICKVMMPYPLQRRRFIWACSPKLNKKIIVSSCD